MAGSMTTDRPAQVVTPFTVVPGRIQAEMNLISYAHDNYLETDYLFVADTLLRIGAREGSEVGVIVRPIGTSDEPNGSEAFGAGDIGLRFKHNLWGNDRGAREVGSDSALAVMPFITLPTGTAGLGYDRVTGGVAFPFLKTLGPDLALLDTPGAEYRPKNGKDDAFSVSNTLALFLTLRHGIRVYGELAAKAETAEWSDWKGSIDLGLIDEVTPDLQLYVATNIGITERAADLVMIFGFAARF